MGAALYCSKFSLMLSFKALNIPNDLTRKMSRSGFTLILIENFVKEISYAFLHFSNHPERRTIKEGFIRK